MAKWASRIKKPNGDIIYFVCEAEYSSDAKTKVLAWMESDPTMRKYDYVETCPYEESPAAFIL